MTLSLNDFLNDERAGEIAPGWTHAAFRRATLALAEDLRAAGSPTVALWFADGARFASALFAAWQAGCAVWLPPHVADEYLAREALWLTDAADFPAPHRFYGAAEETRAATGRFAIADTAQLFLHTSGSSGDAKSVGKTLSQLEKEAQALAAVLPAAWRGLPVAASVSVQHMYGLTFRVFAALACGWQLSRTSCTYPEDLIAASATPCLWISSPALLNRLGAARDWDALSGKVCGILSAGGALPAQTAALLQEKLGILPTDIYGSTETGVIARRHGDAPWQALPGVGIGCDGAGLLWAASPWTDGREQTADAARIDGDTFTLHGRGDRILKFEDKRVSLAAIEHQLLAHPFVHDAHCGLHHQRIAAWLALSDAGIAVLRDRGRAHVQQALKAHLARSQETIALPRYWRFADHLPRNAQTKIRDADFHDAFHAPRTTPQWQATENDDVYVYTARVPLDLVWFAGHFADFPLVPGVIELQWVMELAARHPWGQQTPVCIENLKYQQFVRPHDDIRLELRHDAGKNKLHFAIKQGDAPCASGRIVWG
ncbi:MAG: AMP-binding protein [Cardiobacteriaceae bacterium]|nr:AMP-binding protein [Cardiobacteriaceae bacterium]